MKWEDFEEGILALDPADRPWEYDGDGTKIYKLECGFTGKTPWDGGYALWLKQYGSEWDKDV
jgi:hypothetical protein